MPVQAPSATPRTAGHRCHTIGTRAIVHLMNRLGKTGRDKVRGRANKQPWYEILSQPFLKSQTLINRDLDQELPMGGGGTGQINSWKEQSYTIKKLLFNQEII